MGVVDDAVADGIGKDRKADNGSEFEGFS